MFWRIPLFGKQGNSNVPLEQLRFEIPATVKPSPHDGGLVLFCLKRGRLFNINKGGAAILRAISAGLCVGAVAAQLSDEFGIPHEKAAADVVDFSHSLLDRGLLRRVGIVN